MQHWLCCLMLTHFPPAPSIESHGDDPLLLHCIIVSLVIVAGCSLFTMPSMKHRYFVFLPETSWWKTDNYSVSWVCSFKSCQIDSQFSGRKFCSCSVSQLKQHTRCFHHQYCAFYGVKIALYLNYHHIMDKINILNTPPPECSSKSNALLNPKLDRGLLYSL